MENIVLDKHLVPSTKPVAVAEQMYIEENLRITVLTSRLLRVETGKTFTDAPSQIVWYRNLPTAKFRVEKYPLGLRIITEDADFFYNYLRKRIDYVYADQRKMSVLPSRNLKGTSRSLDNSLGRAKLSNGVISRSGVAELKDDSLLILPNGLLTERAAYTSDTYVFAHGIDYRRALRDFYQITGYPPLLPRFALGNWWSRWKDYSQSEYMALMERFRFERIPFSVAVIDMDWHWVNIKKHFPDFKRDYKETFLGKYIWGDGWTGYSWNRELFPDYKGLLKWLQSNGLKPVLNLHPASGIRNFDDIYKELCKTMGLDSSTGKRILHDMTNPQFINAYFKIIHRPYEKDGVEFWWLDWQQGKKSNQKGLDPLWALNHYHTLDFIGQKKRPLILSRYSGPGSHRHPVGFSGDTFSTWKMLNFLPYFTATAANIGFTWWSHDLGGFCGGIKNDELYLRWLQFGVFSPITRLHSVRNDLMGKEIWNYRPDVEHYAKKLLQIRHAFIPYIYTMNMRTHKYGIPLCEPLYYQYPLWEDAYKAKNQYFFGSELLVAPITKKSERNMSLATVKIYLPSGRWTDIFTGTIYKGGREYVIVREINEYPVFAKEGAIIPMSNEEDCFDTGLPKYMEVWFYRGTNEFCLYEDNGKDTSYQSGNYAETQFSIKEVDQTKLRVKILAATGAGIANLPKKRKYKLVFRDISSAEKITVTVNDKPAKMSLKTTPLTLVLENIKPQDTVRINICNYIPLANVPFKHEVVRLFSRLGGRNFQKNSKYRRIKNLTDNKEKFARRLKTIYTPRILKTALKELIDLEN